MLRISVLMVAFVALALGCSSEGKQLGQLQEVKGSVKMNGKAVENVRILFFAAEAGQIPSNFDLKAGGTFDVKVIPGKYTFAFESSGNAAALKAIPVAYQINSADHSVELKPGAEVTIEVK